MIRYIKCLGAMAGLLTLVGNSGADAQSVNVHVYKGKITNAKGATVSQVGISVQGGNSRAVSGKAGEFSITCSPKDTLVFIKEGFVQQKVAAGDAAILQITLKQPDAAGLFNEVVNIPFAQRTKRELNYAISSLQTADLPKSGMANMSTMLGGRLSGLLAMQTGNQPGADIISFQVRGKSSYAQGAAPVILVDGVERDFDEMDPNEIESVTVLKDAASLSWYGLNAGNGALLVTTRHGKANQNYVDFTAQTGFEQASNVIKSLNSYQFATLYNQGLTNAGQTPAYTQAALDGYLNHTDPYLYPDNNYVSRFLGKTAPMQRYSLAVGGGSERIRYFTTVAFLNQNGLFKETQTDNYNSNFNYRRFNFRVNLDYNVTQTLSFTVLAGLRSVMRNEAGDGTASILSTLFNLPPNAFPIQNADGTYGGTSVYQTNPLGQLQSTGVSQVTSNALTASIGGKQKLDLITPGLSANVFFAYDGFGDYTHGFTQNYSVTNETVTPAQTYRTPAVLAYRSAGFGTNTKNTELWLGFDYDHAISANNRIIASVRAQQAISSAVDRIDYRGQMLTGRVDYSYKNRYFLGVTGSYSGSEDYAPGRRFGFFPAASAGWVISDEDFLKDVQTISYLKLRASYGRSGNVGPTYDASGNLVRLPYRALFTRGAGPILGSSFSSTTTAYEVSPSGNPLTTWEKIDRLNIGTDWGLFKNALSFSVDYFDETRKDILTSANLPGILGISVAAVNSGKVNSKGVDISAAFQKSITDKLHIAVNANFTYAANKLLEQSLPSGTISYQSPVGVNIGNVSASGTKRFYVSDGIFQSQVEIDASPKQTLSGLVVPGDIKYKDINGDNVIDSRDAIQTNYTDVPKAYYGFGFNVSYGLFDISTQFQGIYGRTIDIKPVVYAGPNTLNQLSLDAWTPATAATARFPRIALSDNGNNSAPSDFWLRSGDFLKLRTAELGFSLPQSIVTKLHMQKARIFVGGYNLLTLSKLKVFDIDPETPQAGTGSSYPYLQTYTLGLNVKF